MLTIDIDVGFDGGDDMGGWGFVGLGLFVVALDAAEPECCCSCVWGMLLIIYISFVHHFYYYLTLNHNHHPLPTTHIQPKYLQY